MAQSGMEMMMVSLLSKMGIDPEMVKGVALSVKDTADYTKAALERMEAKLDRIEIMCDRIFAEVEGKPDGGFIMGDGSPADLEFRGLLGDGAKPFPENVPVESQIPAEENRIKLVEDRPSGITNDEISHAVATSYPSDEFDRE